MVVCGGGGGLGHFAIQYARAMGGKVIAIDAGSKRELCESLGADEFVDFTAFQSDTDMKNEIIKLTNGGARIVLQCTSSSKAYSQSMSWLGFRGTLACLGIPEREGSLVPSVAAMVSNELRIIGTRSPSRPALKALSWYCIDEIKLPKLATGWISKSVLSSLPKVASKPNIPSGKWKT